MTESTFPTVLADYQAKYGHLITAAEAAQIARVPLGTVYNWSHQGQFDSFKHRKGRRFLLELEAFLRWLFEMPPAQTPERARGGGRLKPSSSA